jgi:predicted Rossmann fold nucleotide-binding protein DprA/Smf involved in DNA uptake
LNSSLAMKPLLEKIISGGQTGVDRAALDVALETGIPRGGWCPQGRKAEDGRIPDHYPLQEASSPDYPLRTRLNVEDSDGTLVITLGSPKGGTALTLKLAKKLGKPFLLVDLAGRADPAEVRQWIQKNQIRILNVAGPREGESAGILEKASAFLLEVLTSLREK